MKVQLYIDPASQLSKVPYLVPNNIHYVKYQDFLDAQNQPDALTAYLYAAELAKGEIKRLKAEVEAWKGMVADSGVACNERARENQDLENQIERLKAEVERLTKAVMHSPAAQLKLKELEGKTTYEEINGKIPPCIDKYEAK
jgi:chromosome segregation ATPase